MAEEYQWLSAATLYKRALESLGSRADPPEVGLVTELLARCYFKGAFQAQTREEFRRRMEFAKDHYETSHGLYGKAGLEALSKRSMARGFFAAFWLREKANERAEVITRSIDLTHEACKILEGLKEERSLGESYVDLLSYVVEGLLVAPDWRSLKGLFQYGVEIGEKAFGGNGNITEGEGLVESLRHVIWLVAGIAISVLGAEEYQDLSGKRRTLLRQLTEVS